MKKKNLIILVLIILVFLIIVTKLVLDLFCMINANTIEYSLEFPLIADSLETITIDQNEVKETIENSEDLKDIINILYSTERKTKTQSIQDFPINVESVILVHFNFSSGQVRTIYLYEKNNEYFIEEAYYGIYRISEDEYNSIEKYIRNSSKK